MKTRTRNRSGRFVRARRRATRNAPKRHVVSRRRSSRRRSARRNPPAAPKRRPGVKGYKTPEATKRKISLAVKRANAARKRGGGFFGGGGGKSRRRSGGSRGRSLTRFIPGKGAIGKLFSSTTVKTALGAVGAGFFTSLVVNRFGSHLPGIAHPIGRVGWRLALPLVGAALVRRYDRDIANGMIIGAAVSGINELIRIVSGSPATVPVVTNRPMAANGAGMVGSGGRGASFNGYAGDVGYLGDEDDFEGYIDDGGGMQGDADGEGDEFSAMVGTDEWDA